MAVTNQRTGNIRPPGRRFSARTLDYARAINIACNRAVVGRESEKGVCVTGGILSSSSKLSASTSLRGKPIRRRWLIYRSSALFIGSPFVQPKSGATPPELSLRESRTVLFPSHIRR